MRKNKHLSIKEASLLSGVPEATIREYETDNREAEYSETAALLRVYQVSLDHLYVGQTPTGRIPDKATMECETIRSYGLTECEKKLVQLVRSLSFEDLLDAEIAIQRASGNTSFEERASNLTRLAITLAEANEDYRKHILPEEAEEVAR